MPSIIHIKIAHGNSPQVRTRQPIAREPYRAKKNADKTKYTRHVCHAITHIASQDVPPIIPRHLHGDQNLQIVYLYFLSSPICSQHTTIANDYVMVIIK